MSRLGLFVAQAGGSDYGGVAVEEGGFAGNEVMGVVGGTAAEIAMSGRAGGGSGLGGDNGDSGDLFGYDYGGGVGGGGGACMWVLAGMQSR